MYDHSLSDISEQMYSNLSVFYDGLNVQITWETSLHCHGNKRQNKDKNTIDMPKLQLSVNERTEIMKPMGLKESFDNWYLDKCKKKIYAD